MRASKIPPPPPLNLGGLHGDAPDEAASPPPDPAPARPAVAASTDRARATIVLAAEVAEQLRQRARDTRRTQADLILSAHLAHYGAVADQLSGVDAERAAVGLPPLLPAPTEGTDDAAVGVAARCGTGAARHRRRPPGCGPLRAGGLGPGLRVQRRLSGERHRR